MLGDDLFRRGTGYFDGVWTQVSEAAQQDLLRGMARRKEAWTLVELKDMTHFTLDELHHHLQLAESRDILRQRDGARDGRESSVYSLCDNGLLGKCIRPVTPHRTQWVHVLRAP